MSDSEEAIWDPISSLGRVMPPSDFLLDSSRSSFSQNEKNWPEGLLPRPSTPQTLKHMWKSLSSELPLSVFVAWTIFMKLGTLVHHVHGYKSYPDFLIFVWGLTYGHSKSKKRGKIINKFWKIITKSLGKH